MPLCVSSSPEWGFVFVEGAVAEHGVEHVAASACECDEGLVVALPLSDFAVVVGARDGVAESRGSGKEQRAFEDLVAASRGVLAANG